ncbi:MAG: hypothetical protein ABI760_14845, partial [Ferruginibacter sp.]
MMKIYLLVFVTGIALFSRAQNLGIGTTTPDKTAILDVSSTNKGLLMPRLSSVQRKAISNPAMGLMVFDTDKFSLMFFDGSAWRVMSFADENKSEPQSRSSSQPAINAGFRTRVSISGDYAVIGAPRYSGSGLNNMGLAYIFNKSAGGWKQVSRLAARDSTAGDYFGGAVAISGDYAIVGSSNKKIGDNVAQGKAYIYRRSGTTWVLDTALVKGSGQAYEDFGWSVGVCAFNSGGPGVAIGIPYSDV